MLEAFGFKLAVDDYGGRRVPPRLADAVKTAREAGQPLTSLLEDPMLVPYLSRDHKADPLNLLIYVSAEAVLCELFGATWESLRCGTPGAPSLDPRALAVDQPYEGTLVTSKEAQARKE